MKNHDLAPEGFFFPLFEELSFTVSLLAIHPRFTLKMFLLSPVFDKHENSISASERYGWELFEKLTDLFTYEYHYLMT
jgi:hypothetical protein